MGCGWWAVDGVIVIVTGVLIETVTVTANVIVIGGW